MKRLFRTLFLLIVAALTLTSCHKEEVTIIDPYGGTNRPFSDKIGSYRYLQPFIDWNLQQSQVIIRITNLSDWEQRYDLKKETNEEYFRQLDTNATERYVFENNKLTEIYLTYYTCNSYFDQMMKDWARNFSLDWVKIDKECSDTDLVYAAQCPAKDCEIWALRHDDGTKKFMSIMIFKNKPKQ